MHKGSKLSYRTLFDGTSLNSPQFRHFNFFLVNRANPPRRSIDRIGRLAVKSFPLQLQHRCSPYSSIQTSFIASRYAMAIEQTIIEILQVTFRLRINARAKKYLYLLAAKRPNKGLNLTRSGISSAPGTPRSTMKGRRASIALGSSQ